MSESQGAPVHVNINNFSGTGSPNMAAGPAQAHQYNLSTPQAELLPLLDRLLADTNSGDSRHAELRKACRNAQGELEESKAPSEPTKTLLQQAIDALPTADKAFEVAAKVADLLGKIPGLGA